MCFSAEEKEITITVAKNTAVNKVVGIEIQSIQYAKVESAKNMLENVGDFFSSQTNKQNNISNHLNAEST